MGSDFLERRFDLSGHGTSVRREVVAGLTAFLAMAYITVVNPSILSQAGMDFGAVFVATCLAAAIGSPIMGLAANYPVALAPGMRQNALSSATVIGAVAGTSPTTSYIESAAGVESGGRTGLTAVVVAALFLLCLVFAPLAQSVPPYASAAALLFVAVVMARSLSDVDWRDLTESAPAALTAIAMPLSFSIADGIGAGFISYAAIKLLSGRPRDCPVAVYLVAAVFLVKFAAL